jgi:cytochrome c oxidase subunit IV
MATSVTHTDPEHAPEHGGDHAEHPSERQYWKIFFVLFAITAAEVAMFYVYEGVDNFPVHLNNGILGVMAVVKFLIVAAYFMHLKFDNRIVRRLFVTGIVLAILVYVAFLLTMGVFIEEPTARQGGSYDGV